MTTSAEETTERFEAAIAALAVGDYQLTLFVTGASNLSARAIANIRRICDQYLSGRYSLVVTDLSDNPAAVIEAGVVAAPTLVRSLPLPIRRVVGDLSQTDKVLIALEIPLPRGDL